MGKRIEIKAGDRYGRLTVAVEIEPLVTHSAKRMHRHRIVRCKCECGELVDAPLQHLRRGAIVSCGCIRKEYATKHGKRYTLTYEIWKTMRQRCVNPRNRKFWLYGGRDITVCDRWLKSFANFLNDMGECPSGYSIDRVDNDGNYEPANCRWATRKQQARNTRLNRMITFGGHTRCLTEWAEIIGIAQATLRYRLKHWPIEDALTAPPLRQGVRPDGCEATP